jgi:hypothetical protein
LQVAACAPDFSPRLAGRVEARSCCDLLIVPRAPEERIPAPHRRVIALRRGLARDQGKRRGSAANKAMIASKGARPAGARLETMTGLRASSLPVEQIS